MEKRINEDESCAQNGMKNSENSLLDLPVEIFLIICSFLKASSLHNLSLVCTHFSNILNNTDSLWKTRINHLWPDTDYPILSPAKTNKLFWKLSCVEMEKQKALWTENEHPLIEIAKHEYSDTGRSLRLMHDGTSYVTGKGRRLIYRRLNPKNDIHSIYPAHYDEIRDIKVLNNNILTCGDNNIKQWIFSNSGLINQTIYNLGNQDQKPQILTTWPGEDHFATGSPPAEIISIFDTRIGGKPIKQYRVNHCTCKLVMNSKYILSGSCNGNISIWDQRAAQIIKHIIIPESVIYMKMHLDCVCIMDTSDDLHILKPQNNFERKSYYIEHDSFVSGVHITYKNLITSSMDGSIRIWSATKPPRLMYTLNSPIESIEQMDYQKGILAVSDNNQIMIYQLPQNIN